MPRNRLPWVTKHYSPTGRRNHGRPLKRLLDTWDRNGSTSGPTPWQIYDDDDDDDGDDDDDDVDDDDDDDDEDDVDDDDDDDDDDDESPYTEIIGA